MQLADHFNEFLRTTVNLGQVKLDLLDTRVEAIYRALKADEEIGSLVLGKTPRVPGRIARSSTLSAGRSSMPT